MGSGADGIIIIVTFDAPKNVAFNPGDNLNRTNIKGDI
jgi:hypothetical protein